MRTRAQLRMPRYSTRPFHCANAAFQSTLHSANPMCCATCQSLHCIAIAKGLATTVILKHHYGSCIHVLYLTRCSDRSPTLFVGHAPSRRQPTYLHCKIHTASDTVCLSLRYPQHTRLKLYYRQPVRKSQGRRRM